MFHNCAAILFVCFDTTAYALSLLGAALEGTTTARKADCAEFTGSNCALNN